MIKNEVNLDLKSYGNWQKYICNDKENKEIASIYVHKDYLLLNKSLRLISVDEAMQKSNN